MEEFDCPIALSENDKDALRGIFNAIENNKDIIEALNEGDLVSVLAYDDFVMKYDPEMLVKALLVLGYSPEEIIEQDKDCYFTHVRFLKPTNIVVPAGIMGLTSSAFEDTENIISITLPQHLKYVRPYAFAHSKDLETINFPDKVRVNPDFLGSNCFWGCYKLKQLKLPDGIDEIQTHGVTDCGITDLYIPSTVKRFGSTAICDCEFLKTIHYNGTYENFMKIKNVTKWGPSGKTSYWIVDCAKEITVECTDKTSILKTIR